MMASAPFGVSAGANPQRQSVMMSTSSRRGPV